MPKTWAEESRGNAVTHINSASEPVEQGGVFEPRPGYAVIFVRAEGERLIFRDGNGEFSRWATPDKPRPPAPLTLGQRRTAVELVPDARPIVGESIYVLTHQMCVPGGWQDVKTTRCRAAEGHEGIYDPDGQDIGSDKLRNYAMKLATNAGNVIDSHPLNRLSELVLRVRTQEGEVGKAGSWDDPSVVLEIAELLSAANII